MSRVKAFALAVTVVLALAGCAPLFEFNLFAGLDNPPTPTADDYTGAGGLDALGEDLNSPATVAALAAEPGLVDTIMSRLATDYLGGDPPATCSGPEAQQAAILYADIALKTTEGEQLVNNIVDALLGGTLGSSSVAQILADIIPPEARANELTFSAMIDALLSAHKAYMLLGGSIDILPPFGEADPGAVLPPGALPGDVAQKALVAYTMRVTVTTIMDSPALGTRTELQALHELFLIASSDPAADAALAAVVPTITPPNPILALLDLAGVTVP